MQESVKTRFRGFNEPFEGLVPFMYLDIKGLVTVGVGNLIDPLELALELPFQWKDKPGITTPGDLATPGQIVEEWNRLKNDVSLAQKGHRACEPITNLELHDEALNALIERRLAGNEKFLKRQKAFLEFENWPADAQLGLLSMAWAMGPGGPVNFRKFSAACERLDFVNAALECKMNEVGNPGLVPRNRANRMLFENAAAVLAGESSGAFQRAILYYPRALSSRGPVSG
jgi:GH24 family phage-related lysozyme (muramidase)